MAYLRKLQRSPFWFLRYQDLETGRWREQSTKLRHDDPKETRKAKRLCDQHSEREAKAAPDAGSEFARWVPDYIRSHYQRPHSLKRYDAAWQRISEWLQANKLRHPRQIRYQHAADFMAWRKATGAAHNTARLELKFFSFVMTEAMRRELAETNPLSLAKIEIAPAKEKPELSPEMMRAARAAFTLRPKWMRTVFEICANLGCRFAEASVPMDRVNLDDKLVFLTDSKRSENDPRRLHCVPINGQLAAYLATLAGQERTTPPLTGDMNRLFNVVLKKATGATSHSLRVSFVTRCHRSGLSESQVMQLVNHSSRLVHRIYTRLNVEDARRSMERVEPPPPPD